MRPDLNLIHTQTRPNIISHLVSYCISFTAEMSELNEILECPQEN